ncbi:hypothetical protein PROVRETT_07131 [Providencia rettgeri DSM 1131]|nr:hypothetical protein PROVRETT_07131 [Providencia rettgeri DSM 1131]
MEFNMKKRVIGLFLLIGLPLVAIADNIHVTVNSSMYSYPDNRACINPI